MDQGLNHLSTFLLECQVMTDQSLKILAEQAYRRLGLRSYAELAGAAGMTPKEVYNALAGLSKRQSEKLREFCQNTLTF